METLSTFSQGNEEWKLYWQWADFSTPYFTLKYFHLKIFLCLLHTGPKSLTTGLQYVVAKIQGGPWWFSHPSTQALMQTAWYMKYTWLLHTTGYCKNDKSLTSKDRSLKTLWLPSCSLLNHSSWVKPTRSSRSSSPSETFRWWQPWPISWL